MSKNATQTPLTLVAPTAGSLKRQMGEVICEQPSRSPIPDILTNDEAAIFLRVSTRTLFRLVQSKKVPAKKVGGRWRFSRAALEKYMGVPQPSNAG
jgi:excisionase family DNA binding protein